ncbi:MAG: peptidase prepilin type [Rhodocyclaceae bacterium]|nr:peptidase prepilin type [Rhodocyclaceae bacterium]
MAWPLPVRSGFSMDAMVVLAGLVPLAVMLIVAVRSDLLEQRIPNKLVAAGMLVGLVLHTALPEGNGFLAPWPGALGPWSALQGLAIGGGAMLPLYILRVMGAGDVKLMAAVGAILGPSDIVPVLLCTFLAGGLVSVGVAIAHGVAGRLFKNLGYMVQVTLVKLNLPGMPAVEPPLESVGKAPYAVAVALGTLSGVFWVLSGAQLF